MKISQEKINEVAFDMLRFCHTAVRLIREGSRSYEDALVLLGTIAEFVEDNSKVTTISLPPTPQALSDRSIVVESGLSANPEREGDDTVLLKD